MQIKKIDHVVITTSHLEECLRFYKTLGFRAQDAKGRWELSAGDFKINVYLSGNEFVPHAQVVQPGGTSMCFELEGDLYRLRDYLEGEGFSISAGIQSRMGARGAMMSFYLRDPDGNLVELSGYGG